MAGYLIGSLLSEDGGLLGSVLDSALEGGEGGVLESMFAGEDGGVLESAMEGQVEEECVQEDPLLGIEANVESNFDINIDFNRRPNYGNRPPAHAQLLNQLAQSLTRPPTTTAQTSVAPPSPAQAWVQPQPVPTASAAATRPPTNVPQVVSSHQPVAQAWVKPQPGVAGSSSAPAQAWVKPPPGTKIVTVTTTTTTPGNAQLAQHSPGTHLTSSGSSRPVQTVTTSSRPVQAITTASRPGQSIVSSVHNRVTNSTNTVKAASTPAPPGTKPRPKVATAYAVRSTNNPPRHVKNLPVAQAWVKQAPTSHPTTVRAFARAKPAQAWVKPQPGTTTTTTITATASSVPARKKKVFVDC